MPFPSLPDTGAEKGKNILSSFVLFCWTPNASPMEEPDTSNHPTAIPTAWILWSGNSDPLLPGTAIPAGATAGKGDPSVLTLLGDHAGEFCFQELLPWNSCGSLGAFQVVSSGLSPSSPLHCILIYLHILWSKGSFSSEKCFIRVWLVRFQWDFQTYFCASSLVKKKKILFPFWQLKVLLPDLNQPAQQRRRAVGRTCSITQFNKTGKSISFETLWQICKVCQHWNSKLNPCAPIHSSLLSNEKIMWKNKQWAEERVCLSGGGDPMCDWRYSHTDTEGQDWWHGDVAVSQISITANILIQLYTGLSRLQLT